MAMSKTQADRLGARLKDDRATQEDLRLLDEYRRSFSPAYESVIATLSGELGMQPTCRPAKSTTSITEKLKRESIRLTQIQDIAGCRVTVGTTPEQEQAIADLARVFPTATVVDRRTSPSHGYRAVHVIVEVQGRPIEVQLRTSLQHLWAELSEKCSDVFDPAIKYGSGNEKLLAALASASRSIAQLEEDEMALEMFEARTSRVEATLDANSLPEEAAATLLNHKETLRTRREGVQKRTEMLRDAIETAITDLARMSGENDDIPDSV